MTKEETIKVLQLLNAFYAGGKGNPKEQMIAWHMILEKYNYTDAVVAVLNFAENDTRQYATFPAVGLIVNEIRKTEQRKGAMVEEVIRGISYGRDYEDLAPNAKVLISNEVYNEWLKVDAEEFQNNAQRYRQILQTKQKQLGQGK